MAEITAALVNALRNETGLPMMDCKKALVEAGGDKEKAKETLRQNGIKIAAIRSDRETSFGRFGIYHGVEKGSGAVVELKCESAPVAGSAEFVQLANDMFVPLLNAALVAKVLENSADYSLNNTVRNMAGLGWMGLFIAGCIVLSQWATLAEYFDTTEGITEKYVSGAKFGSDKIAVISIEGVIMTINMIR